MQLQGARVPTQSPTRVTPGRPPAAPISAARRRVAASGPPSLRLGGQRLPAAVGQLIASPGPGEPLSAGLRAGLERTFGTDLGDVRVHADPRSTAAVAALPVRAFAFANHIFLAPGQRATDPELMGHEVAHVLQQEGDFAVQPYSSAGGDRFESEARSAGAAARTGGTVEVRERTGGPVVQGSLLDFIEDKIWDVIHEYAPELESILRMGVLEWLQERLSAALDAVFDTLAAPFRAVGDVVSALGKHFTELLAWMRDAGARLARGDCSALSEAAEKIEKVVTGLASPVIDRVKELAGKVADFFKGLWDRFGAPAWEFLKKVGGAIWEKIQKVGAWLWDKTKPIRDFAARAWRWFKNWLGIGEGEEGQNGVLQWFQRKAEAAWNWVKDKLERFKKPLMVIGGVMIMLSPAGPLIVIGAVVVGLIQGVRWIRANIRSPDGVVNARDVLRKVILPQLLGAINGVTAKVQEIAAKITGTLGKVVGGLGELAGALAGSILRAAVGVIEWLVDKFGRLLTWATEGLSGLADAITSGLDKLIKFAQPVLDVLGEIAEVVGNILRLPMMIAGRLWNLIPACIRNPFVNFLVNQVLKKVPIFAEIVGLVELWGQVRDEVFGIVRQVFRDRDLVGAGKRAFRLLLRVLRVPIELVQQIIARAASAWDAVLRSPVSFLRNVLRAIKQGFGQFFDHIGRHLLSGVAAWIFGGLGPLGIQPPSSFTDLPGIFRMVLQIMGITVEHVFELLGRRLPRDQVQMLRRAFNVLTGVWEWVGIAMREGPAGLWRKVVEQLRGIGQMVLDAAISWLVKNVIEKVVVRLVTMLDPTGIMAVVNSLLAVYAAIQTALEYLRRILEIVNSVLGMILDIAAGSIGPAATLLEQSLAAALPIVIGFLANYLRLGKLEKKMHEVIAKIREKVDNAILWLIDRALAVGRAILAGLGLGQQPATEDQQHAALADAAAGELIRDTSAAGDYDTIRRQKEAKARTIETDYTRRLRPGIRLRVIFKDKASDEQDQDIDFDITIAPNTTTKSYAVPLAALPQTVVRWFSVASMAPGPDEPSRRSKRMLAAPLSNVDPGFVGSESQRIPIAGWYLARALNTTKDTWVRAHLLSARLYGPGNEWKNLSPATIVTNKTMEGIEHHVEGLIHGTPPKAVVYEVVVEYRNAGKYKDFAKEITVTTWAYDSTKPEGKGARVPEASAAIGVDDPGKEGVANLSRTGRDDLIALAWVLRDEADAIVRQRQQFGEFTSTTDLRRRLEHEGVDEDTIKTLITYVRFQIVLLR